MVLWHFSIRAHENVTACEISQPWPNYAENSLALSSAGVGNVWPVGQMRLVKKIVRLAKMCRF